MELAPLSYIFLIVYNLIIYVIFNITLTILQNTSHFLIKLNMDVVNFSMKEFAENMSFLFSLIDRIILLL